MRIGIIAEGRSDIGVITNIVRGITGLERADIVPLRPSFKYDKTDKAHLAHLDPDTHGSWTLVKADCEERKKFEMFLSQAGNELIILHLDAAEAHDYGVEVPSLYDENYCLKLRELLIGKLTEWLGGNFNDKLSYAIAIQEIDAWVLTIYEETSTCMITDAKRQLGKKLSRLKVKYTEGFDSYLAYTDDMRYSGKVRRGRFLEKNCSLRLFTEELSDKFQQFSV